jgi:molecular chaperone GrpE
MVQNNQQRQADDAEAAARNSQERQSADASGETSIAALQAQLSEEKNRADGYYAQWQRAAADYQNFKRRTEQEREEYSRLAATALVMNLLPAIDDFDRALATLDPAVTSESWAEGIRQIQRKLKGALEASGVSEITAEGETFDPNVHEAISEAPGDHGKVVQEVRRGYKLGNRVIRPSLVVVGNGQ